MSKKERGFDWNFWAMLAVGLSNIVFMGDYVFAKSSPTDRCTVRLSNREVVNVQISAEGTALNFPVKPSDVVFGKTGSFGVKYVANDITVSPLSSAARSNLFVYLEGRQFTFRLSTVMSGGCAKVFIRDSRDSQVTVDGFFRPKK